MSTNNIASLKKGLIQIALFLPILLGLLLINNSVPSAHAQIYPPVNTFPQPAFPLANSIAQQQLAYPYLPPPQTTFAPSVFPPTQSFLPGTSFAVPTGNLSPWFPSVPAIACGGTFSLTIVGDVKNNNNNNNNHSDNSDHNNNNKKTLALQIKSAGGTNLDSNTIEGQLFKGKNNIEHNQGQDFSVKSISNDCQLTMFSK
jgi:hypothetical protein